MHVTFIIAKHFGVTPFEIMAQDLEAVLMVVNYLVESGRDSTANNGTNNTINEKEKDKSFWSAL